MAILYYEKALELDPDNNEITAILEEAKNLQDQLENQKRNYTRILK